ncbi:hypothetical protein [Sutcliffiella deserti]|uniref:hypothetical protein n=1 Tax=Sutcliffiella deserti TaxID=2875501 RepID=UPI001CBD7229|nr:hypothetical protein [Sutcliffiella deserti]
MSNGINQTVSREMLEMYYELNKQKKEIELQMKNLKEKFHQYFDLQYGPDSKAEITMDGYKLQRQIKKTERFIEEETIKRLEELQMVDLIKVVKKPDEAKIEAAIQLNLLKRTDLEGCKVINMTPAISVKPTTPR